MKKNIFFIYFFLWCSSLYAWEIGQIVLVKINPSTLKKGKILRIYGDSKQLGIDLFQTEDSSDGHTDDKTGEQIFHEEQVSPLVDQPTVTLDASLKLLSQQQIQDTRPPQSCSFPKADRIESKIPPCEEMDRMKGITDKTFIAKGTYGKVYAISLTKDTPISDVQIPKIEKDIGFGPASLSYDEKMTSFKEEITKQKILGDELSPIIFDEHICEQDGVIIGRIIMEKMDGHLGEFIEQYGLEEDHLTEILKLVQRMHQKKVAHRDLRLENILFKRDPQTGTIIFKIIDFGLSHYFEDPSEVAMGGTNFQGNFDRGNFAQQSSKDFVHFLSSLEDSYGLKIELAMSDKTIRSGHFADPHFVGRELRQIKQIRTAIDLGAVGMIKGKMMAAISPVQMVPYDDDTISFVREGKLRRLNGKKIRVQL